MTFEQMLKEWHSKKRTMGCVAATNFVCCRMKEFKPYRYTHYNKQGDSYQHVVAKNGHITIDLTSNKDAADQ